MKKVMVFFIFAVGVLSAKTDDKFITGELDNGLTYYIRENSYPEKRASLRLIVKVGSIYEEEDERGIAHFVEHMVFRGSRHFKDGEIFDYLEANGSISGADTNAYTGFDSTVYMLEISLNKKDVLQKGILILSDLGFHAELPDDLLEREREVIMDEYHRSTHSSHYRIFFEEFNALVEGSSYANRAPIGIAKVIQHAPAEKMRAFYHKWYRPDRMAVVAVGDFDAREVEEMVRANFGAVSCPTEEVVEPNANISLPSQTAIKIHHDEELAATTVSFKYYYSEEEREDKEELAEMLLGQMLYDRFSKLEWRFNDLFLGGFCFHFEVVPGFHAFEVTAACYEDRLPECYQALSAEIRRVYEEGFTENEWNRAKKQYLGSFKTALAQVQKTEHAEYVSMASSHYLKGRELYDKTEWYEKILGAFQDMALADIDDFLAAHPIGKQAAVVSLHTPSQKVAERGFGETSLTSYEPAVFAEHEGEWISEPREERGEILGLSHDPDLDLYAGLLSNGVRVVYKPSHLEKEKVLVYGYAKGGFTSFPENVFPSACFGIEYLLESGFGGLKGRKLREFLAEEEISLHLSMNLSSRKVSLVGPKESLPRLFEILHHIFGPKQYDEKAWNRLLGQSKELFRTRSNNPELSFEDFTDGVNTQGHYLFRPLKPELADKKTAGEIVDRCFSFPHEFTFMVIGDFSLEQGQDLSEKYLASLPAREAEPLPTPIIPRLFPQGQIIEEFRKGRMENASTLITIPCDFATYNDEYRTHLSANAASVILQQRLENALRKQMGNTYGVGVDYLHLFYPQYHNSVLQITFTGLPSNVHKMGEKVREEIRRLQMEPPTAREMATFRELFLSALHRGRLKNSYWIKVITRSFDQMISFEDSYYVERKLEALTAEDIQRAAQVLLSSPDFTQLTHMQEILDLKKQAS